MRVIMPTITDPGEFVYDAENPTKYTEAVSHALHLILFTLSTAGFCLSDDAPASVFALQLDKDRDGDTITMYPDMESFERDS